jgi:hypothetical protein
MRTIGREEIERLEIDLAVSERLFDKTIEGAERVLRARERLRDLLDARSSEEICATAFMCKALAECLENIVSTGNNDERFSVEQESARFTAAAASEDGLTWPVQVMRSGWAHGRVDMADPKLAGLPHFFPREVVAQVAEACNNARFGRRHPSSDTEETDAGRVAGYLDSGRVIGTAAHATLHLFENEKDIQGKLMAAKKADKLDLFGASVLAYFSWRRGKPEGRDAMVAQKLCRLVSVDLVTEAGAGGRFLPVAAG